MHTCTRATQNQATIMKDKDLERLSNEVTDKTLFCSKEVLTAQEVARYMGVSMSQLYKLTMKNEIPHFKPTGKICYFNRKEVEAWLQTNRVSTKSEIRGKAQAYCMRGGAR